MESGEGRGVTGCTATLTPRGPGLPQPGDFRSHVCQIFASRVSGTTDRLDTELVRPVRERANRRQKASPLTKSLIRMLKLWERGFQPKRGDGQE